MMAGFLSGDFVSPGPGETRGTIHMLKVHFGHSAIEHNTGRWRTRMREGKRKQS